jgi:hypothetical protein
MFSVVLLLNLEIGNWLWVLFLNRLFMHYVLFVINFVSFVLQIIGAVLAYRYRNLMDPRAAAAGNLFNSNPSGNL